MQQKSSGNGKFTCEDTEEQKKFILNNCHKNQISCSNLGIPPTAIIQFFPELESSVNDNCVEMDVMVLGWAFLRLTGLV
ncbi:unnamed protein product [Brassica oleracea var. botrytis]